MNRWSSRPVVEARLSGLPCESLLPKIARKIARSLDAFVRPAWATAPSQRLRKNGNWGNWIASLAAELHRMTSDVDRGCRAFFEPPASAIIALECDEHAFGEQCLTATVELVNRAIAGKPLAIPAVFQQLSEADSRISISSMTRPVVEAARDVGIPVRRLDDHSLAQLGEGIHQQRICSTETWATRFVAERMSLDKDLCKSLWMGLGIPTPQGRSTRDVEEALRAAHELGWPVVVKPRDADYGRGVTLHIESDDGVRVAWKDARRYSKCVLVERFLPGDLYRLLVVGEQMVSAVRRAPPAVTGDGIHSVRELIDRENANPRRGPDWRWPMRYLRADEQTRRVLEETGMTEETIPARGAVVPLRRDLSFEDGGTTLDVTDEVHPQTQALAVEAAGIIGLDVAGLDLIAGDIRRPLHEQTAGFLEINAQPALHLHLPPISSHGNFAARALVGRMFPSGSRGRIPLCVVVGEASLDPIAERLANEWAPQKRVAVSTPDQTLIDGRAVPVQSPAPADRLDVMMRHPCIEMAVLITRWADILEHGLGTDQCTRLILADSGLREAATSACTASLVERLLRMAADSAVNIEDGVGSSRRDHAASKSKAAHRELG